MNKGSNYTQELKETPRPSLMGQEADEQEQRKWQLKIK